MPKQQFFHLKGLSKHGFESFQSLCSHDPIKDRLEGLAIDIRSESGTDLSFDTPIKAGYILDLMIRHTEAEKPLVIRSFTLDKRHNKLVCSKGGKTVVLTEKETAILEFLGQANGQTVLRQDLLENVWGYNATIETQTLETHIYRLRQKIEDNPAAPALLLTKDGGYSLVRLLELE